MITINMVYLKYQILSIPIFYQMIFAWLLWSAILVRREGVAPPVFLCVTGLQPAALATRHIDAY